MNAPPAEVVVAAPPVAYVSAKLCGVPISEVVVWLNLIYIVLALTVFLYNRVKEYKNVRARRNAQGPTHCGS